MTPPTPDELAAGVRARDRALLGRAITLIESNAARDRPRAEELLSLLLPEAGRSVRVGITGVPGVGKSSLIEALGVHLVDAGHRLGVLAVDPSSELTRGSILGDKTRMVKLATHESAFIRPSPTGGTLGGVARKTREAIAVLEAAGHDVILVETVGVGQSEVTVHSMVDCFLLLLLPGAGDELQGIKKGIVELADVIAITKADGSNQVRAGEARNAYARALHYLALPESGARVEVRTCSSVTGEGLAELWRAIEGYVAHIRASGYFEAQRRRQARDWMHALLVEALTSRFFGHPAVASLRDEVERDVIDGRLAPTAAVERLLAAARP